MSVLGVKIWLLGTVSRDFVSLTNGSGLSTEIQLTAFPMNGIGAGPCFVSKPDDRFIDGI